MLWTKTSKLRPSSKKVLSSSKFWLFLFILVFFATRVPRLHNDIVNPDSANWHIRSEQFVQGLKYQQFEKTYQHYQPGVTLMWIVGPTVELIKQFTPGDTIYSVSTFPTFHYYSKLVLIFVQLVLTLIAFFALEKLTDWKKALMVVSLFTFEPFFIGNSRVLHMDVLLALFLFNGLLFSYWNIKDFKWWKGIVGGFFLGCAALTKSVGIGGILFASWVGGMYLWWKRGYKERIRYRATLALTAYGTIFILFPALWVDFSGVMSKIWYGIARVGVKGGHNQIFFGHYTRNGGVLFYIVTLLLQLSPFLLLGIILALTKVEKNYFEKLKNFFKSNKDEMSLNLYLAIFYVGYFVVMSIGSKKIDRYMIPLYPALSMISVHGFYKFKNYFKDIYAKVGLVIVFSMSLILPLFTHFPYYFTYTNPLFGTPEFVHKYIVAQKPFGLAAFDLINKIHTDFGYQESIAFSDPKPFFYLHDKDKVKYTYVDGTRTYSVLVVGVNEEFPYERIYPSSLIYDYYDSIYVNGLEYWKIYVRSGEKQAI